jgi:hypothetical protein
MLISSLVWALLLAVARAAEETFFLHTLRSVLILK